jgi:HNH endonuclease
VSDYERKLSLFRRGSRALRLLTGRDEDRYGCPLCRRAFQESAIHSGELTLEHAPPEALGGKAIALTCQDCNSVAGRLLDAEVYRRDRLMRAAGALRGQSDFDGLLALKVGDVQTRGFVRRQDDRIVVSIAARHSAPMAVEAQAAHLRALVGTSGPDRDLQIGSVERFHPWRAQVGDLKSAFIIAFAALGYSYAFHERLRVVRDQIQQPDRRLLEGAALLNGRGQSQERSIMILHRPTVAVLVRLGMTSAILPWIEEYETYPELTRHFKGDVPITAKPLPWPTGLALALDFKGENG